MNLLELLLDRFKLKYYFVCFLSGSLATISLPPNSILPFIFFLSIPVFYFSKAKNIFQVFLIGTFTGFGWFSISLYWIVNSLFIAGSEYYWMTPFIFIGFPLFLSLFWGSSFLLSFLIFKKTSDKLIFLGFIWSFSEFLRGHMLTGFPWNMPGFVLSYPLQVAQSVSIIGPYGQNLIIILIIISPILWKVKERKVVYLVIIILLTVISLGYLRLFTNEVNYTNSTARLVQPVISHESKWDKNKFNENLNILIELSKKDSGNIDLVIWPETALTTFPEYLSLQLPKILNLLLNDEKSHLISGIPTKEFNKENEKEFFNSILMFNKNGEIVDTYNKLKLVPFGEYIPYRKYIPFVKSLANDSEFSSGKTKNIFSKPGIGKIQPMICYEAIFPGFSRHKIRPDLLVNITNDYWFGNTIGPKQHLLLARMRAIETGVPLIRVSNSGISAAYDPFGREIARLKWGKVDFIDVLIPKKSSETIYNKYGEKIYFFMSMALFFLVVFKTKVDQE